MESDYRCVWTHHDTCDWYYWETSCDNAFEFTVDGPKQNGFQYCPYCGRQLEAMLATTGLANSGE